MKVIYAALLAKEHPGFCTLIFRSHNNYYMAYTKDGNTIYKFLPIQLPNISVLIKVNTEIHTYIGFPILYSFSIDGKTVQIGDKSNIQRYLKKNFSKMLSIPYIAIEVAYFLNDRSRF